MHRPTVNDIAREARVSLATVDRVLNARRGVRPQTIAAVNEAVSRLGYVRDVAAANLARGRSYAIAVALPDSPSQFVQALARALDAAAALAAAARTEVRIVRFPAHDLRALAVLLAALPDSLAGVALMAPETPVVRDAAKALRARGVPVVALVSDLPGGGRDHFVGIDGHAAGRTAAFLMGRFLTGRPARVMVLAPSMLLRDSIERRRGFDEVVQAEFPAVEVLQTLETHGSDRTLREVVAEMLRHVGNPDGVYLLGSGHRALGAALADLRLPVRPVVMGHELTPSTRAALRAGEMDAVVTQNLGHLARSALRILRAHADGAPIDEAQERPRIEIVTRENLPPDGDDPPPG